MKEEIIEYIKDELLDDDEIEINENTSLFRDKVLDSMSLVGLIGFLEENYEIKILPMEIMFENLDTVSNIIGFIERKKSGQ
ncbi:MAG: acyl carrier protein [Deltaproteobacteria bacterium]|nr:acyl carrier protein [Deltaproteobacteria bacterium]